MNPVLWWRFRFRSSIGRSESADLRSWSVVRLKVFSIEPEVILTARGVLSPTDRAAVAASFRRHHAWILDEPAEPV